MEDRDKYLWRPNDNSVRTKLRFDLETTHWLDSVKNATPNTTSFSDAWGFVGLVLSLTFNILLFLFLVLIDLIKWVIRVWPKRKKKRKYDDIPTFENKPPLSAQEVRDIIKGAEESGIVRTME